MSKEQIFDYISSASGLLPLIALIYNYRHLDNIAKIIGLFLIVSAISDLTQWLLPLWHIKNILAINIFVILNIVFFGVIYYKAFFSKEFKILTVALCTPAFIIAVYFARNLFAYPTESNTASSIVFIILSLFYFYQLLTRQEFVHIEKQGLFWFNAAVLFYFSINIFLFMLIARIPADERPPYYMINNITNIIANLLYTTGLLCQPQKIA